MAEEQFISHVISNIGVPAALCFYTLVQVKQSVDKLSDALNNFSQTLTGRIDKLEHAVEDLNKKFP